MPRNTPASRFVTDTMGLVLRLERRIMGPGARAAFAAAEAGRASMLVPAIVMAEVLYLSEKGRIEATLRDVDSYMKTHRDIEERPLDLAVVKSAAGITDVGELCS